MKNFTGWLAHQSHLAWVFSPCVDILISFLPHVGIFTSCGHSQLTWAFSLKSHLMWAFSPHLDIFTLHGHSDLAWAFSLKCHLSWIFSPHMHILTSCEHCYRTCALPPDRKLFNLHPNMTANTSPFCAPLHAKIIFFTLCRKTPKKSRSNPNSINNIPLRATNKCFFSLSLGY